MQQKEWMLQGGQKLRASPKRTPQNDCKRLDRRVRMMQAIQRGVPSVHGRVRMSKIPQDANQGTFAGVRTSACTCLASTSQPSPKPSTREGVVVHSCRSGRPKPDVTPHGIDAGPSGGPTHLRCWKDHSSSTTTTAARMAMEVPPTSPARHTRSPSAKN